MEAKQLADLRYMRKPDNDVIQSLANLEDNNDFKNIIRWMLESSGDIDNVLRNAESETTLHRAQGASSVLMAMTSYASNPRDVIATIKRKAAGIHLPGDSWT